MGRRRETRPRKVTVIRYHDAEGRRCKRGDPGARKVKTQSDSYYAEFPPKVKGGSKERVPLGTTDEAVAWVRLRQLLEDRHREELGILDDYSKQAARPIAEHVEDWLAAVAASGVKSKRVGMLRTRVGRLIELAKWRHIGQIRKSSCQAALAKLQEDREAGAAGRGSAGRGKGASAQTRNHYLGHARQFTRWLLEEKRLASDPLAGMRGVNADADRRHDRRCPGDLEVRVLFEHLAGLCGLPKVRKGMSGPQRALGYQVAMCTGLRAGELRRLHPGSFDLEAGTVRVPASSDKARKRRVQALPHWLKDKLRLWLGAGGKLWDHFPEDWPGRLLRDDLALARAAWINSAPDETGREEREKSAVCLYEVPSDDGPLYWDFHALRHWYISQVAALDGIAPSTLQTLSRHSDPRLTLGVYAKSRKEGERDAVERIARPGETSG